MRAYNIITGDPYDAAHTLATIPFSSLDNTAQNETFRLRHAYQGIFNGGINIIDSFSNEIGIPAEQLSGFINKHAALRGHVYLSSPYIIADLFNGKRLAHSTGERLSSGSSEAKKLVFLPTTTWSKVGDAVFRFTIMHRPVVHLMGNRQLRIPVVMMDKQMMDVISRNATSENTILQQMQDMLEVACHDYIHTTFLYYPSGHAPHSLTRWNDELHGGKKIWDYNQHDNNYEVLAGIGHRRVMQRVCETHPEFKSKLVSMVSDFSQSVMNLCESIRANEPDGDALSQRMEHYLMTNYMRFAYQVLDPKDVSLSWVGDRYPFVANDLNITNGRGLVSILHAHDGVPGKSTGDKDVTFRDWLNDYVARLTPVVENASPRLTNAEVNPVRRI